MRISTLVCLLVALSGACAGVPSTTGLDKPESSERGDTFDATVNANPLDGVNLQSTTHTQATWSGNGLNPKTLGTVSGESPAAVFGVRIASAMSIELKTIVSAETPEFDSVMYLYTPNGQLVAWNDDVTKGTVWSRVTADVEAGYYVVVVRGYQDMSAGNFELYLDGRATVGCGLPQSLAAIPSSPLDSSGVTIAMDCFDGAPAGVCTGGFVHTPGPFETQARMFLDARGRNSATANLHADVATAASGLTSIAGGSLGAYRAAVSKRYIAGLDLGTAWVRFTENGSTRDIAYVDGTAMRIAEYVNGTRTSCNIDEAGHPMGLWASGQLEEPGKFETVIPLLVGAVQLEGSKAKSAFTAADARDAFSAYRMVDVAQVGDASPFVMSFSETTAGALKSTLLEALPRNPMARGPIGESEIATLASLDSSVELFVATTPASVFGREGIVIVMHDADAGTVAISSISLTPAAQAGAGADHDEQ